MWEEENTFPSPASPGYNTSSMFWEEKYVPPLHLDTCLPLLPSLQAVDLSLKFVPERSVDVAALVSDRLANMGRYVQVRSLYDSIPEFCFSLVILLHFVLCVGR